MGNALTIFFAGFALTMHILPKISFLPALVAGFVRVLMRQRPGMVKMPVFFTSLVPMATKLLITAEHCFCFKSCSVAMAFVTAPFDMAFLPVFMAFDFMGG